MHYFTGFVGIYFIFCACAVISIIVWIFNWVCWKYKCCCCDFLHNTTNKRLVFWFCFSFLLGIIACCISAFITINRFHFTLEGSLCAVDRIYYDSLNGQLKTTKPRWEGFNNVSNILGNLSTFLSNIDKSKHFDILIPENWSNKYNTSKIHQLN